MRFDQTPERQIRDAGHRRQDDRSFERQGTNLDAHYLSKYLIAYRLGISYRSAQ
jgi:hypothetical protein